MESNSGAATAPIPKSKGRGRGVTAEMSSNPIYDVDSFGAQPRTRRVGIGRGRGKPKIEPGSVEKVGNVAAANRAQQASHEMTSGSSQSRRDWKHRKSLQQHASADPEMMSEEQIELRTKERRNVDNKTCVGSRPSAKPSAGQPHRERNQLLRGEKEKSGPNTTLHEVNKQKKDCAEQIEPAGMDHKGRHKMFDEPFPNESWEVMRTRPAHLVNKKGVAGHEIRLTTNYFPMEHSDDSAWFLYSVSFSFDEQRPFVRRAMLRQHKGKLPDYFFDGGSKLLSLSPIQPQEEKHTDLLLQSTWRKPDGSNDVCTIKIRWLGNVDKSKDLIYQQLLSIIQRQIMEKLGMENLGRNFYDPQTSSLIREHCMEVWPGYITSVRKREHQMLYGVEAVHKIIRTDTVYDQMAVIYNRTRDRGNYKQAVKAALAGSIIMTRYNKKTYRIDDIDWSLNPCSKFLCARVSKSYKEYYMEHYGCNIHDLQQPLLVSRPKDRHVMAVKTGPVLLVPELCHMTGLMKDQRGDYRLGKTLNQWFRMDPSKRVGNLLKVADKMTKAKEVNEELKRWQLKFSPNLLQIKGRVLPLESITLNSKIYEYSPAEGWNWHLQQGLLNPGQISNWFVIYPAREFEKIKRFLEKMLTAAVSLKIRLEYPRLAPLSNTSTGDYLRELSIIMKHNPEMVMCIVPRVSSEQYAAIKKATCVDQPVPCQIVTLNRALKMDKIYHKIAAMVVTQMAVKLGAEPWALEIPIKGAMVIGYDTFHDTVRRATSVGALVASLNHSFTRYFSAIDFHKDCSEMSNKIGVMFKKALLKYYEYNQTLPNKIFFYRDGVGDGLISHVIDYEMKQLKKFGDMFGGNYNPKITFVIVSKRISTRLFGGWDAGAYFNPPPGTVVDDHITLSERYDFFLVSQVVNTGTVSPTCYNVIMDESGLSPDHLQRLTYKLCHLYYNCTGTVRVPAPCHYAHKLALLAGTSLHAQPSRHLSDLLYFL